MTKKGNVFITDFLENNVLKSKQNVYVSGVGDYKNIIEQAIRMLNQFYLLRKYTYDEKR